MEVWIVTSHAGPHYDRLVAELELIEGVETLTFWRDYHFQGELDAAEPDFIVMSGLCKTRRFSHYLDQAYPLPWLYLKPLWHALRHRVPLAWVRTPTPRVIRRIEHRLARLAPSATCGTS